MVNLSTSVCQMFIYLGFANMKLIDREGMLSEGLIFDGLDWIA